jgi:succinate dehydrogenase / fumarate reductase membrane anchor subunit
MSQVGASGLRSWIIQRLSAVYLALFLLYALVVFSRNPPVSYQQWHDWFAQPVMNIASGLFFIALLLHTWVGIRDVILDYVKPFSMRLAVLVVIGFAWLALALWVLRTLVMLTS